jgi:hypothetical protein
MGTELTKTERGVLLYKLANEYYNLAEQNKRRSEVKDYKDKDIFFLFDLDIFFTENKIELIKNVLTENQIDL